MAQIKIFGHREFLQTHADSISASIHKAVVCALQYPPEKKFHRFIPLEAGMFFHPQDRSLKYLIIEISMFSGRSMQAKRELIRLLYTNLKGEPGISEQDVEITIFETPQSHWGIRGKCGDELVLSYKTDI